MNDIIREFLVESHESLAQLDLDLVTLEKEPGERETLARVFRVIHTVKGTAGFLGLAKLQAVGHAGETLLSKVRSGVLTFNADIATALLGVVDAVRKILAALEANETEGDGDYSSVIQALERLIPATAARSLAHSPPVVREAPVTPPPSPPPPGGVPPPPPPPAAQAPSGLEMPPPALKPKLPAPESGEGRGPAVSDSSIRVDVGLLDKLMTLVGELVLARNQIVQYSGTQEDSGFLGAVQRLNGLTTELQAGVMKTRMQPIGNVWAKFPRVVRDLAIACGKQVRLEMDGQETELDRTIIEAIRDPLTHIVRNAIDHGIEFPRARTESGKPPEGRLLLHAYHESGKVVIEIGDDGGGIDPQRVRDKAVSAKIVTPEGAARMTEVELLNLIFLPGFSTTDRVTHFSGRGVGMDVVRTNVEKIGGVVDVQSRLGRGTTIKMKIPLTLAIVPALTVVTGGDRYAIPQVNLLELVRLEADQVRSAIEFVHGAPVYRLRGSLLPLVYLARELRVESLQPPDSEVNIVILQADDRRFGLVVDEIRDSVEIVVKPLQKLLKGAAVFAGATIMDDGRVALILDVVGLAQRANVVRGARERALGNRGAATGPEARQLLLLFATPGDGRVAVPLDQVARLEEFDRGAIETVGGAIMVQYRGTILPLLHATDAVPRDAGAPVQVVVFTGAGAHFGLVVERVLDIVESPAVNRSKAARPGVLFNAVVHDRITEFLDVDALVQQARG
ncbi:chemotaxis protein CheA [Gemmata sp. G18]|uniref:histidine kinase n=1 Tax=Gemmata palustris TaxID=2822762 RepID=A0ABS5BKH7_9BACT|nr:chemotaxis protein CheA [Gemmata palustris]MBP3954220.1 chemotaxis protein CheA [Gemmata palustris]